MDKLKEYLEHIQKMLKDNKAPELTEEQAQDSLFKQIHEELSAIRETSHAFSIGDFSANVNTKGFIAGCLKTLQANLRHLTWQTKMVEKGDFTQEVKYMGDFSIAFNSMIHKLRQNLSELQEKEKNLTESEAKFKFLASHDPLTGIYNRRSFSELAEVHLINAIAMASPCCMSMMDIDHFKIFNDTYGHVAGDEALRHVVRIIESNLRRNDFMGRYGGEEFILFFSDTDVKTGFHVVERLRKKLAKHPVQLDTGPVSIYASFGLVENTMEDPKEADYVEKLINNADAALYAAKNAGRNRVIVYTPNLTHRET
jgi:diguanylate cyclase (GGDEF)-like protein